jgi:FKBP-type peptidyl-prolyl cis-trans isomerase
MVKSGLLALSLLVFVAMISCGDAPEPNEREIIKAYIKDSVYKKNSVLKATVDKDSLLYVFFTKINANSADTLSRGKEVTINSVGKFLNKQNPNIFDNYPLTFVLGSGSVIIGLNAGVAQMKKGEKAIIIFTSSIGYGATKQYGSVNAKGRLVVKDMGKIVIDTTTKQPKFTNVNIPPSTPLAFEIEVVK